MKKTALVVTGLLYLAGSAGGIVGTNGIPSKSGSRAATSASFTNQSVPESIQKTSQIVKNPSYDEFKLYIKNHKYVLVELGAPYCGPCKSFEKVVGDNYSKDPRAVSISFVFVDVSDKAKSAKIWDEYAIKDSRGGGVLPQIFLVIDGKVKKKDILMMSEIYELAPPTFYSWLEKEKKRLEK